MPFVYLLRCADGTLYVGHTHDLASREKTHNDGHGSTYTESRRPVEMVDAEEHHSLAKKKQSLVDGDLQALKGLSRQHQPRITVTWRALLRRSS